MITVRLQHLPVAQVAFENSIQVSGLQQRFPLQDLDKPQSHSSPGSTKPLPQVGESNSVFGLFLERQQSITEGLVILGAASVICKYYNRYQNFYNLRQ